MQRAHPSTKAELRLSEDRVYGAATKHRFVVNKGTKKTQFLWVFVLYHPFTCCHPLVPAPLPLNRNASAFLQITQVPYCIPYLLCSFLCSQVTTWARPPGRKCFQVALLSWPVRICWVVTRAKKIDHYWIWVAMLMLDEALICATLLYSTAYAHDNISFETVLLWQICWNWLTTSAAMGKDNKKLTEKRADRCYFHFLEELS